MTENPIQKICIGQSYLSLHFLKCYWFVYNESRTKLYCPQFNDSATMDFAIHNILNCSQCWSVFHKCPNQFFLISKWNCSLVSCRLMIVVVLVGVQDSSVLLYVYSTGPSAILLCYCDAHASCCMLHPLEVPSCLIACNM